MNIQLRCPNDSELSDLLDGNLVDPELSRWAEHLETCVNCQQVASRISTIGTLVDTLRAKSEEMNHIVHQTPQTLLERIKQIPMLATEPSRVSYSGLTARSSKMDTIEFSSDPTPGVMGKIGQYRILRLLGSGGMGSVFLAEDIKLHRQVALKVMLPTIAVDPVAKERFLREARAAASLKSDHVVTVHQVGEEDSMPYLAMELLLGCSLDERIRTGEPISVEWIIHIAMGVAKGLSDAHEKGMVHRDIKPGNIWLEQTEERLPRIKILDFGLARTEMDDTHLTQVKAIVGTPAFMAPEQARGNCTIDARSDLFSLGCVIYYLCTGEVPFKAENTLATLMALAVNTPQAPSHRNSSIPIRLSNLTMDLLHKDPIQRPETARDVLIALSEIKRDLYQGGEEYTLPRQRQDLLEKVFSLKKNRLFLLAGCVAIFSFLALLWSYSPRNLSNQSDQNSLRAAGDNSKDKSISIQEVDDLTSEIFRRFEGRFKLQNPEFFGQINPVYHGHELSSLTISGRNIRNIDEVKNLTHLRSLVVEGVDGSFALSTLDLSPLARLPLQRLVLLGGYVTPSLQPIGGLPLEELQIDYSPVSDLSPLKGMQLKRLNLWNWIGSDLTPLHGMPLRELNLGGNRQLADISPLAGSPIEFLCINLTRVSDLSPLRGAPIKRLYCSNTLIGDVAPLVDAPVEELLIAGTKVRDISFAKRWPLKWIELDYDLPGWHDALIGIESLERIKDQSAKAVLAAFDREPWRKPDEIFANNIGIEFVRIPKGKMIRGRSNMDEYLQSKEIEIHSDFYLGRYEITQKQWVQVMGQNPSYFGREGPGAAQVLCLSDEELLRLPVERVSWLDCQVFLQKLNELDPDPGWKYRLPTEAEWTYACQGGPMNEDFDPTRLYFFQSPRNNLLSYLCNSKLSDIGRTISVGTYPPNSLGLSDMHGNVWEWCDDLANVPSKRARWIHGGSWRDEEVKCCSSYVLEPTEGWTYYDLGFRVAKVRAEE